MKSFIVDLWSQIFDILGWISPFRIICHLIPATRGNVGFTDGWVLGNLLLSIGLLFICQAPNFSYCEVIAVAYGGIRVFEVFIYQINILLFDEYRARKAGKKYAIRSYRRIVINLLHNYVEVIFWFALIYRNIGWAFDIGEVILNSFFISLNLSFVTMTTFGQTNISPKKPLGNSIIFIQSVIGLFMALIVLARFISLIPIPETLDEFEKKCTNSDNDQPTQT